MFIIYNLIIFLNGTVWDSLGHVLGLGRSGTLKILLDNVPYQHCKQSITRKGIEKCLQISYGRSRKSKFLQIPLYNMMERLTNNNNLEIFMTEPGYSNN